MTGAGSAVVLLSVLLVSDGQGTLWYIHWGFEVLPWVAVVASWVNAGCQLRKAHPQRKDLWICHVARIWCMDSGRCRLTERMCLVCFQPPKILRINLFLLLYRLHVVPVAGNPEHPRFMVLASFSSGTSRVSPCLDEHTCWLY